MKLSKSKLDLAKVINENGGWLIAGDYNFVTSNHRGVVKFFHQKPRRDGVNWVGGSSSLAWVDLHQQLSNWHQTILSREEYYQAYPNADADGWIECGNGYCPVIHNEVVDVKFSDGEVDFGHANGWNWSIDGTKDDIVAYRLHKPKVKPEFCESVMRSIPEPEEKPTIEKLAQDYRNKIGYAKRKLEEAEGASVSASSALSLLRDECKKLGLDVSPSIDMLKA